MGKYNRDTLKNYFGSGERPTGETFKHLIDSTVNILDDQFSEKANAAIKVTAEGEKRDVISMYKESGTDIADWTLSVETNGDMVIRRRRDEEKFRSSLVFKDNGDIELNGKNTWISGGRKGKPTNSLPADGKWQNVMPPLSGVNILEITAVYTSNSGRSGTLVAWASCCLGKKRKIRRMRPRTFFWNNKLKIRWVRIKDENGHKTQCVLQIRTRYKCSPNSRIKCSITQLWNNSDIAD